MSIATVITQGIGPDSSIETVVLDGYTLGGAWVYTEAEVLQGLGKILTLQSPEVVGVITAFGGAGTTVVLQDLDKISILQALDEVETIAVSGSVTTIQLSD